MTNAELLAKIKAEIERRYNKHKYSTAITEMVYAEEDEQILSFLSTLESEKPMNLDDAMKELDEKIALVKERGTWDGVDVDKYMDEVRGREPEKPVPADLEEAAKKYAHCPFTDDDGNFHEDAIDGTAYHDFIAGAVWQKEQDEKDLSEKIAAAYQLGLADKEKQMKKSKEEV